MKKTVRQTQYAAKFRDPRHSSVISWAIRTPEIFKALTDAYFKELKRRRQDERSRDEAEVEA